MEKGAPPPKGQGSEMVDLYKDSVHLERLYAATAQAGKESSEPCPSCGSRLACKCFIPPAPPGQPPGEQAAKPRRPPKEWPMRLSVPGDSRTLLWHGFRCASMPVRPAGTKTGVMRTCITATGSWEGEWQHFGVAILRPGDTFNRVLGKRLALSRLVKLLIPGKGAGEKKKRGKLFLALAPTPRAPRVAPVNGSRSGVYSNSGIAVAPVTLASLSMADWDKASAAYYNRYREQQQKEGRK